MIGDDRSDKEHGRASSPFKRSADNLFDSLSARFAFVPAICLKSEASASAGDSCLVRLFPHVRRSLRRSLVVDRRRVPASVRVPGPQQVLYRGESSYSSVL